LNIIEYLFCERLFGKVLLIEKSAAEKVRQKRKNAAGKSWQKNVQQKMRQKNHGRKSAAEKVRQKNRGRKSRKTAQKNRGQKTAATKCYKKKKGMVFICVVLNL
jgi:hypothetical protein